MDPGLIVSVDPGVTRIRFTRPEYRNALTRSMCGVLRDALVAAAAAPACRFVVIEGSGGAFASGADIAELERLRAHRAELLAFYRALRDAQELLYGLDKITIAVIDGFCIGAGLSLALACDLRLATPRSVFSAPPAKIGLIYSDIEVGRLALHIGAANARDLLFTGRRVAADEALRLGLIERLTASEASDPAETAERALHELLEQLATSAPGSLRQTKQQLLRFERAWLGSGSSDAAAEEAFFKADAGEGMRAFLERRMPRFS
jgi:enoyl-CoA hydratase/carnithine racemase